MDSVKSSFSLHDLEFCSIPYGTPLFDESLALRHKLLRVPLGLEFSSEQIADEWDSHHLGIYLKSGRLIASLTMKPLENDIWKMRQVVVEEWLHGQGIGKFLVLNTEGYCRSYGVKKIVLHARDTAVPCYLSLEYKEYGDPFEEVGIPHIAMSKILKT